MAGWMDGCLLDSTDLTGWLADCVLPGTDHRRQQPGSPNLRHILAGFWLIDRV